MFADPAIDGDVRCHLAGAQRGDEALRVEQLIGTQRDTARLRFVAVNQYKCRITLGGSAGMAHLRLNNQPVAVLHQGRSKKAQLAFLAIALAEQPCIRVGG